jgi:flagellin FlaB
MMKLLKNEDAFTGLEAAIVLIAFIVVAAVFSYVMLGAGFFATQEAQRTVHTGSQQASSSLEIIGNIYGMNDNVGDATKQRVDYIEFTVGNTAGGSPIDITQLLVTFVCGETSQVIEFDEEHSINKIGKAEASATITIPAGKWGVVDTYNDVGNEESSADNRNKLLEPGEQFVLRIMFPDPGDDGTNAAKLTPNTRFSVNLQPAVGAAFPIKKTVPSNLDRVNII